MSLRTSDGCRPAPAARLVDEVVGALSAEHGSQTEHPGLRQHEGRGSTAGWREACSETSSVSTR